LRYSDTEIIGNSSGVVDEIQEVVFRR
jgi:hypothetical protein